MRVADAIVDILKSEGVKFVAALPGDDILPLFDAFHQQDDIPLVLTRHEQAPSSWPMAMPAAAVSREWRW